MTTKPAQEIPDTEQFVWSYTESGHGKGSPDGVGATCKRTTDTVLNSRGVVNNIDQFKSRVMSWRHTYEKVEEEKFDKKF